MDWRISWWTQAGPVSCGVFPAGLSVPRNAHECLQNYTIWVPRGHRPTDSFISSLRFIFPSSSQLSFTVKGLSHWVTRGQFFGLRQNFHHWGSLFKFDVNNPTARHQCENGTESPHPNHQPYLSRWGLFPCPLRPHCLRSPSRRPRRPRR